MIRVVVGLLAASALAGCGSASSGSPVTTADGTSCQYGKGQPAPDGLDVGKPAQQAKDAPGKVVLATNLGDITITLDTVAAPCTTRSFRHLAGNRYFDTTPCHRLTAAKSLSVLQCGDPTGRGIGGPGYTLPDENPRSLKESTFGSTVIYPRGTVAMANTGKPNSGGSQFFLVYADSTLPPTYAVFGSMDEAGLAVVDKVVSGGITPQRSETDGSPTVPVKIQTATVQ